MNTTEPRGDALPEAVVRRRESLIVLTVTIIVPSVMLLATLGLMLVWIAQLPAVVATHWAIDGTPDRFGSPWVSFWLLAGIGVTLIAAMGTAIVVSLVRGSIVPAAVRLTASFIPAIIAFLCVAIGSTTAMQVGLDDPDQATGVGWAFGAGLLVSVLVGFGAWLVLPSRGSTPVEHAPEPAMILAVGERASWSKAVSVPRALIALPIGLAVLAVGIILFLPDAWFGGVILLIVDLALCLTLTARVTVDESGLAVRTPLGIRLMHVPLDEVRSAADVRVAAFAEFGGLGVRVDSRGRRGVVLRSGEAIEVSRTHGAPVVVVVADARTGAALLNGLVERSGSL